MGSIYKEIDTTLKKLLYQLKDKMEKEEVELEDLLARGFVVQFSVGRSDNDTLDMKVHLIKEEDA